MKIEEAIKILQVAKAEIEWSAPLDYQDAIDMAIEALEKQMTKKGKLLFADYETELWGESSICGLCGCSWQIDEDGRSNFCPNCGAKMER